MTRSLKTFKLPFCCAPLSCRNLIINLPISVSSFLSFFLPSIIITSFFSITAGSHIDHFAGHKKLLRYVALSLLLTTWKLNIRLMQEAGNASKPLILEVVWLDALWKMNLLVSQSLTLKRMLSICFISYKTRTIMAQKVPLVNSHLSLSLLLMLFHSLCFALCHTFLHAFLFSQALT